MEIYERAAASPPDFKRWLSDRALSGDWTWDAPHQRMLISQLDKVTRGGVKRLLISMPPRHGKSEMVTVRYCAWRLEADPHMRIIIGSYNQRLANRFSRSIRRVLDGRVSLAKDSRAVDEWETAAGGGVKAVGVGAGITGFGAGLIVIDDPVKSRAEAESMGRRERAWEWFTDDLLTRLEPDGALIIIQTRWHHDDLTGRILDRESELGDKWQQLSLPAIAEENDALGREPGSALWPARFDETKLAAIRQNLGTYSFSALYQQSPVPRASGIFRREWFDGCIVDAAPSGLRWYRGYDLAVSTKTTADYTASFRCAVSDEGVLYIADGFRRRIEFPDQRKFVIDRLTCEREAIHGIEAALHGTALVQELLTEGRFANTAIRAVRVDTDKLTRALGWAARAEAGRVRLVRGAWIGEFLSELSSFPSGAHDDQIDAVSLAVQMMGRRRGASYGF